MCYPSFCHVLYIAAAPQSLHIRVLLVPVLSLCIYFHQIRLYLSLRHTDTQTYRLTSGWYRCNKKPLLNQSAEGPSCSTAVSLAFTLHSFSFKLICSIQQLTKPLTWPLMSLYCIGSNVSGLKSQKAKVNITRC